ncbi:MAG: PAS domain-containing protein [Planctomycetota bacterium]
MAKRPKTIINEERQFLPQEVFFSTTDAKGVIRYGNQVFCRIADYPLREMVGAPHSLIRHPDMPACVFYLLWDLLGQGRTAVAYVKNLAADGRYYWVLAVVSPMDDGYYSMRMKPTSGTHEVVESVYERTLAIERKEREAGRDKTQQMEAGLNNILSELAGLGFSDYDSFVNQALLGELESHHQVVDAVGLSVSSGSAQTFSTERSMIRRVILLHGSIRERIRKMLAAVRSLKEFEERLSAELDALLRETIFLGITAINCRLAAEKPVHHTISQLMGNEVQSIQSILETLSRVSGELSRITDGVSFSVSTTLLQTDVGCQFAEEIAESMDQGLCYESEQFRLLMHQGAKELKTMLKGLRDLQRVSREPFDLMSQLGRCIRSIDHVRIAGLQEAALLPSKHVFASLFHKLSHTIHQLVEACQRMDDDFADAQDTIMAISKLEALVDQEHGSCEQALESLASEMGCVSDTAPSNSGDSASFGIDSGSVLSQ